MKLGAAEFVVAKEGMKVAPMNHLMVTSSVIPDWNL